MTEAELCAEAVAWLRDEGFDVHQEVTSPGGLIDILAVGPDSKRLWAIEAKLGFGLDVLRQAVERKRCVHRVSVLVPRHVGDLGREIARTLGIGIIERLPPRRYGSEGPEFVVAVPAPTALGKSATALVSWWTALHTTDAKMRSARARSIKNVRAFLCDETRDYAQAGNPSPSHWSPFKALQRDVPKVLQVHGPLSTRALYEKLRSSERPSTVGGLYAHLKRNEEIRARGGKDLFPGVVMHSATRPAQWRYEASAVSAPVHVHDE
jgi:hypothetical protein